MKTKRNVIAAILMLICLTVSLVGCGSSKAAAEGEKAAVKQTWPEKEIHFIWHSKAGSSGDILLRTMGKVLEQNLGKPIVVENREGAGGFTAWNYVKNAAPDGYTFAGIASTFITSPLQNRMNITPEDYDMVALMFLDPLLIYCRAEDWKDYDEFSNYVKQNPGKLKIAGGTPGNLDFMLMRQLKDKAGLDITGVPFEGGGDAPTAVLGKHLDIGIGEYAEVASLVEAGKLKVLVSFDKLPGSDVKTIQDYGINIDVKKFRGVMAPKGTPPEIIDKMYKAIADAYNDPGFIKYYETSKLIPYLKGPADAAEIVNEQYEELKASL